MITKVIFSFVLAVGIVAVTLWLTWAVIVVIPVLLDIPIVVWVALFIVWGMMDSLFD